MKKSWLAYYSPVLWKVLESQDGEIKNIWKIVFELQFWSA